MRKASGIILLIFVAFAVPAFGQRYTVFPQFASGGGWSSKLFFSNQGISTVSGIDISFYDTNGASLSVESNLGIDSSFSFDLTAGQTQAIDVTPNSTLVEGYVVVTYPSGGSPVRATLVYRYEQGGTVQVEAGVPQQEKGDHFSFPVEIDSSKHIYPAIALISPEVFNPSAQTLVLNLIKPDGNIQATATVPMQPGEHIAGYLDESWLFPGLDNFTGSLSVSSPLGVGVLALRQDKDAFGAIATDGGPILGPFALSSSTILVEQEPNDNSSQALLFSGNKIISGTIGTTGDLDAFKFYGHGGDIISVLCNTMGTNSYLDSVLEIYDGNLNLIAQNDQNGLAPQLWPISDSFIQMVLPSDDTYYIVVTDYYGDGGSGYTYRLHVKLQ
jgi:hypothetical protein